MPPASISSINAHYATEPRHRARAWRRAVVARARRALGATLIDYGNERTILPKCSPRFIFGECLARLGEREDAVHDGFDPVHVDGATHRFELPPRTDRHTAYRDDRRYQLTDLDLCLIAADKTDHADETAESRRRNGRRERCARRFDRDVDANAAGGFTDGVAPLWGGPVIDRSVRSQLAKARNFLFVRRERDDARAGDLREL